ncbi:hypothetical protein ANN_22496 [Periplaneta americana]|uniref:Uncharacterized protein n=1 Tax=Periplaneta americana TaxID=6978 RepID=A0ABQ8S8B3_PERAM|nr:hypothetical protein ANN_22496 [Periplaneta americana]
MLQESDNLWWDAFATEFFEDDATLTLTFCLEDGPKRYTIGRTLIPRYFRSIFEGGVTELYYNLKHPKESFHNTSITLDCDQCTMVTHHGKPMFTKVCTEGRLILEFTFDDLMRIKSWHFAVRTHRELVPRSVVGMHSQQDPGMLDQLSKNITRQGITNSTLNYLRLSCFGSVRIDTQLDQQLKSDVARHNEMVKKNREILKRLIDAMCFLAMQELPFRGHGESEDSLNKGNYIELLHLLSNYDTTLREHLESSTTFKGTSNRIQNDLITAISGMLMESIKNDISMAQHVAIILDETSDINSRARKMSSLVLMSIEKKKLKEIRKSPTFHSDVIEEFSKKERRMEFTFKEEIQFNNTSLKVDGFVDFGDLTPDTPKHQLANHGLVFMFIPFFQSWVQPIAIYASRNAAPGDILAKIFIQVILQLEEAGARVVGFTCDGSQTNKAWKLLGISGKKGQYTQMVGHLERTPENRLPKRALYGHPGGARRRGRPRLRWFQDVEDDLWRVGCRRWRQRAQDRYEWFQLIEEAQALYGL